MEKERGITNREAAQRVLTEYYRLLDTIPDDMSLEDGEVLAGDYLREYMLSGQFTSDEIAWAHYAVDRESWGETGYAQRLAREGIRLTDDS